MSQNEPLQVTEEFLKQNLEHSQLKKSHKKGGPYSKHDRDKRRKEIHRLHFEYGYSARKIADLMKISRHTINGDIDYLYSKISKDVNFLDLNSEILAMLERMHVQMTRLREQLDKTSSHSERMGIERLVFDINSKILHTYQKLAYSENSAMKVALNYYNSFMKKNNNSHRGVSWNEISAVSQKAHEKIMKIIQEDKHNKYRNKKF